MANRIKSFRVNDEMQSVITDLLGGTHAHTEGEVIRDALTIYHKLVKDKKEGTHFLHTTQSLHQAYQDPNNIHPYDPFAP